MRNIASRAVLDAFLGGGVEWDSGTAAWEVGVGVSVELFALLAELWDGESNTLMVNPFVNHVTFSTQNVSDGFWGK